PLGGPDEGPAPYQAAVPRHLRRRRGAVHAPAPRHALEALQGDRDRRTAYAGPSTYPGAGRLRRELSDRAMPILSFPIRPARSRRLPAVLRELPTMMWPLLAVTVLLAGGIGWDLTRPASHAS